MAKDMARRDPQREGVKETRARRALRRPVSTSTIPRTEMADSVLSGHGKWREEVPNVLRKRQSGRKRASAFGWECSMRDIGPTAANGCLQRSGYRDVDVFVRNVTRRRDEYGINSYGATVKYEIRTDTGRKVWSHEERIGWAQRRRKTTSLVQLESENGSGTIAGMVVGALDSEACAEMEEAAKLGTREGYRKNRVASLDRVELTEGDDGSYSGRMSDGSMLSVYFDEGWCWEETRGDEYVDGEAGFAGIGSCIADMRRKGYEVRVSRRSDGMQQRGKRSARRRAASHDDFEFYGDEAYMRWYGDDGVVECHATKGSGYGEEWSAVYYLMDPMDDFESKLATISFFDFTPDAGMDEEEGVRERMDEGCLAVNDELMYEFNVRLFAHEAMEGGRVKTREDVADAYRRMYGGNPSETFIDSVVRAINDNYAVHIGSKTHRKKEAMDIVPDGYVIISRDGSLGMPRFVKYIGQLDALLMDYDTGNDEDRLERLLMLENDVELDGYGECKDPDLVAYAVSCDWSRTTPRTSRKNARRNAARDGVKTSRIDKYDIVKDMANHCGLTIDDMSDADDMFEDETKRNDAIAELSDVFSVSFRNDPEILLDTILAYDEGIIDGIARAVAKDVVDRIRAGKRNGIQAAKMHRNTRASMRKGAGFHSIPREFGGGWIETDEVEPGRWRARGSQGGEYATRAVYGRTEQEAVRKAVKEMQGYPEARDLAVDDVMGAEACRSASRRGASARRSPAKRRASSSLPPDDRKSSEVYAVDKAVNYILSNKDRLNGKRDNVIYDNVFDFVYNDLLSDKSLVNDLGFVFGSENPYNLAGYITQEAIDYSADTYGLTIESKRNLHRTANRKKMPVKSSRARRIAAYGRKSRDGRR